MASQPLPAAIDRLEGRRRELARRIAWLAPNSKRRGALSREQASLTRQALELELSLASVPAPPPAPAEQERELRWFQK